MLVVGGGLFYVMFSPILHLLSGFSSFLANCAFVHTDIRKKFASPSPRIALFFQRVFFREGFLENSRSHSYSQRALDLGRVLSLLAVWPLVCGAPYENVSPFFFIDRKRENLAAVSAGAYRSPLY